MTQIPLLTPPLSTPPIAGLSYHSGFLTEVEERELLTTIEALPFRDVVMRGVTARRKVAHFGWDYDYAEWSMQKTSPPPGWLVALRNRAAAQAGADPESFAQFLIGRYPAGATIGWHRDAPMFGSPVLGISLRAPCRMRFRRRMGEGFETAVHPLAPRSLYVLAGEARTVWQHSIPPVAELRYSITMRTVLPPGARKRHNR